MFVLTKEFTFEAAHYLPYHDGKCARLHGHSYRAVVYVAANSLVATGAKQGMVIDYSDLKAALKPLLDNYLDHHYLNESLQIESPTAEEIAKWIYTRLEQELPGICGVLIKETCTSSCFYVPRSANPLNLSDAFAVGGLAGF